MTSSNEDEYKEITELAETLSDDLLDAMVKKTTDQVSLFLLLYGDVDSYRQTVRFATTLTQSSLLWLIKEGWVAPTDKAKASDEERATRKGDTTWPVPAKKPTAYL